MLIKRKSIEKEESLRGARSKPKAEKDKPAARRKPKFEPVTLSEQDGVRYLHFGTEWIQGAMRIRKPDWLELEYSQQMMAWMLFNQHPQHIVQLGLGTGALTKFCHREFPQTRVTTIELDPAVIAIGPSMFKLPQNNDLLSVIEMDAHDFVNDPAHLGSIDVLQVDLYDATARGPVLDTPEFYAACEACLTDQGVMTVNLFGEHPSYNKNFKAMRFAFQDVVCLPPVHDGNVIAIAFKRKTPLDFPLLYERASRIHETTRLPAKSWVNNLKLWRP